MEDQKKKEIVFEIEVDVKITAKNIRYKVDGGSLIGDTDSQYREHAIKSALKGLAAVHAIALETKIQAEIDKKPEYFKGV